MITLVLLAAGMGSRFGGPKQLVPVGPSGETILDYNAHDGIAAGFERVVVVTRAEIEAGVRSVVDAGPGAVADTRVVLQSVPEGRDKPLGTADAVAAAAPHIDGPFAVANADDLYGPQSFDVLFAHLAKPASAEAAVVGFPLGETVPAEGAVSRAVLRTDSSRLVRSLVEVHGIARAADGGWEPAEVDGVGRLTGDVLVSMNLWGLPESAMGELGAAVARFVASGAAADPGAEIYLPDVLRDLIVSGQLGARVLRSPERWSGLTNPDDVAAVRDHAASHWPSPLWEAARRGEGSLQRPRNS